MGKTEPLTQQRQTSPSDQEQSQEPVAWLVESWNDLSGTWETSIRRSRGTLPDADDHDVRTVVPLVPSPEWMQDARSE